jgi:putative hydrolase of the HAD superfamily
MPTEFETYPQGQTLLIDADDTLWENNIYFERAIAAFISYVNHHEFTREDVREKLNEVERETVVAHGYGLVSFRKSLVTCFERLSAGELTPEKHERIVSFVQSIADQEIQLLPGVAETLPDLASRHRLILMTKGNQAEQADKLARSGVASYFSAVEIPKEKNAEAYRQVCAKYELAPHTAGAGTAEKCTIWMIGNSPRSDINPALAAGLNAIYIHHPSTWVLEHDEINTPPGGQKLLELGEFAALARHF